ncbi:aminodeoxychorismate synthase component I [Candidatus Neomarinimicrobiota bacterium]
MIRSNHKDFHAIIQDGDTKKWLEFRNPIEILVARKIDEVLLLLEQIEIKTQQNGLYAAGFISYEAASAFDRALTVHPSGTLPLLSFGLYENAENIELENDVMDDKYHVGDWTPSLSQENYRDNIARIKQYIAAGETYQVNFTFRLNTKFSGDPFTYFCRLIQGQKVQYGAYLNLDSHSLCSISPELFFQLDGNKIFSRPMKGTASRGLLLEDDNLQKTLLQNSEKNQAENRMVVDMMRNDIGKIAIPGSISIPSMFKVECYPTVWQMVSTVEGTTPASIVDIFTALFPCASITGPPKPRTMEIINELESKPRQIYTGTIGYIAPNRKVQFNVAIRTIMIDKLRSTAEYGVGGGIVWDSTTESEYEECKAKALVLTTPQIKFSIFESILWEPENGYYLLTKHLERMEESAKYFRYVFNIGKIRDTLNEYADSLSKQSYKVRLLLDNSGKHEIEKTPVKHLSISGRPKVKLAREPINPSNAFLYHKTTNRKIYNNINLDSYKTDDVLFWNQKGEVTESTISNFVARFGEKYFTPPVKCGLLPGVFRSSLLKEGKIEEKTLTIDSLQNADEYFLISSVRKWRKINLYLK